MKPPLTSPRTLWSPGWPPRSRPFSRAFPPIGSNTQRFTVTIQWSSTWGRELALVRPLDFHGLDFLWAASVVIGLYAVHRLLALPPGSEVWAAPSWRPCSKRCVPGEDADAGHLDGARRPGSHGASLSLVTRLVPERRVAERTKE